ncbi:hypothetical protein BpHYR1_005871 [Brachionus plicatilis]|uniref:Uncharacterized protein n=1 Tax=Brachionus plicatilis TaxID=10195 RepID=A0A3M7TAX7_BRAPC|nr:hypothetical protein BpHYR1_005871 [Brachionus plicatilis]
MKEILHHQSSIVQSDSIRIRKSKYQDLEDAIEIFNDAKSHPSLVMIYSKHIGKNNKQFFKNI